MTTIALFIARLLSIYSFVIWIRILASWMNPFPQPGTFTYYLARIVDPYLNTFRSSRFRAGMLDFSPIIGIGILSVVQSVFEIYGTYGMMSLSLIVQLFISAFWSYGISIFFTFGFILLVMKTIASFMSNSNFAMAMSRMDGFTDPITSWVRRTFFKTRFVRESTLNIITLLVFVVLYFTIRYVFNIAIHLAARIPF